MTHNYDNDFNEILPGIYLGGYEAIFGKEFKKLNIKCIISMTPEEETPYKLSDISCYRFPITSKNTIDEIKYKILECVEIMNSHKNIYIHCYEGVSRSAICVLYYIYKLLNKNIIESYEILKKKRNSVNPNEKMIDAINLLLENDTKLII